VAIALKEYAGMFTYLTYILLISGTILLNTLAQRLFKQRWNFWLGYGVPALLMLLFLWDVTGGRPRQLAGGLPYFTYGYNGRDRETGCIAPRSVPTHYGSPECGM
jgi:hypothetical protein